MAHYVQGAFCPFPRHRSNTVGWLSFEYWKSASHVGSHTCNSQYCISMKYLKLSVEVVERLSQRAEWYQHVLDTMILLVHGLHCLALCQLQKRYFCWHHPAKQPSKHRIVPKWDNILQVNRTSTIYTFIICQKQLLIQFYAVWEQSQLKC